MLGICNGFQALIKLGLVPYGEIRAMDEGCPTLTFNTIGRHQSRYVTTRVASVQSPGCSSPMWATSTPSPSPTARAASQPPGGAGAANRERPDRHPVRGPSGAASMDIDANPNGSLEAIEGIFSPTAGCSARWATRSAGAPM